jgi:hypothetical protein
MRPLNQIAKDIREDWSKRTKASRVPDYADAYLRPMETLSAITDNYHLDSAKSIVLYFLANANTYKGEKARALKEELKDHLRSVDAWPYK